jgi:nucleotide-binding universal stress UspA family protein
MSRGRWPPDGGRRSRVAFKDLLLVLRSFPTPTPEATIEQCVELAAAWGARISAVACGIVPRGSKTVLRHVLIDISAVLSEQSNSSAADAEAMLRSFRTAAEKRSVFGETVFEKCELPNVSSILVDKARLRDLAILPVPDEDYLSTYDLHSYAEALVFDSGRPTLVLPQARKVAGAGAFETVVVAWDGSRASTRAIADALPILRRAKATHILTMANRKTLPATRTAPALAAHLATHGVSPVVVRVVSAGRGIEVVFAEYAASCGADLIVMGAFGHSRLRDFILGGATQRLLSDPPTALFLSH